jgi:hypothetical protein
VDGSVIQTQYCNERCIEECFDGDRFRYTTDGKPMQIEVASDTYPEALVEMQERIRKGQVPGVKNPKEAENLVRKGNFTYAQAKNIARFGTIESLTYDAVNGISVGGSTMGVTAIITLTVKLWNGEHTSGISPSSCGCHSSKSKFANAYVALPSSKQLSDSIVRIAGQIEPDEPFAEYAKAETLDVPDEIYRKITGKGGEPAPKVPAQNAMPTGDELGNKDVRELIREHWGSDVNKLEAPRNKAAKEGASEGFFARTRVRGAKLAGQWSRLLKIRTLWQGDSSEGDLDTPMYGRGNAVCHVAIWSKVCPQRRSRGDWTRVCAPSTNGST